MKRQLKRLGFVPMVNEEIHNDNDCDCKITHYSQDNVEIRSGFISAKDHQGKTYHTEKLVLTIPAINSFLQTYLIK